MAENRSEEALEGMWLGAPDGVAHDAEAGSSVVAVFEKRSRAALFCVPHD
jgi:hypothetical protein